MGAERSPPLSLFSLKPPHPYVVWMAGGRLVRKSLPAKQFPSPAGPARTRSARLDPRMWLPRTSLPWAIQKFLSMFGKTAMP
jgi:hypothetical protein